MNNFNFVKNKILLIDVGNTNIKIAISEDNFSYSNIFTFTFFTDKNNSIDDFGIKINFILAQFGIKKENIKYSILSSVVPEITKILILSIKKYINENIFLAQELHNKNLSNIVNFNYPSFKELGEDRLINILGGAFFYKYPIIIIDIGTAITIDIINDKKEFIGGIILPGPNILISSLSNMTSKLKKINFSETKKPFGTNTIESINIGLYSGILGEIKYFCENIKKENSMKNAKIILTGGFTNLYKNHREVFDIFDKNLTIKALKLIYLKFIKNK